MKAGKMSLAAAAATIFLTLNGEALAQPTVGNYPNTSIVVGGNTTIGPTAAPVGSTRAAAVSTPGFTGSFLVSPTTGVLRIINAGQPGTYTVTVRFFNAAGQFVARNLVLTVTGARPGGRLFFRTDYYVTGARQFSTVIAVGDLNNDGIQDLITAGGTTVGAIAVMLGQGNGAFAAPVFHSGGSAPVGVAVADFNGDGRQDIVTVETSAQMWIGNGNGTFAAPVAVAVGTSPFGVVTGDFNNDGNHDFATANAQSQNVSVRLGNGTGGFGAVTNVAVGGELYHLAVSDFNNDNNQDLAVLQNFGGSRAIAILIGNGAGGFVFSNSFTTGSLSFGIAKLNADANQDLIGGSGLTSQVSALLGNGSGSFGSPIGSNSFTPGQSFGVADLNADGIQDLVVGGNNALGIQFGNGNGTFTQGYLFQIGSLNNTTVTGDFNGDGRTDIALQQNLPNCPSCTNTTTTVVVRRPVSSNVDFDGDAVCDLSVFRPSDGTWYIRNSSNATVSYQPWGTATDRPVPADYDGDGKTDIAVWRAGAFGFYYILNSSNNTFRLEQFGQTGDQPILGDFSFAPSFGQFPDGKADLAVYRNGSSGGASTFFYRDSANNPNNAVTYVPWGIDGDRPVAGDYNGDGTTEIAVFRPSTALWYIRTSAVTTTYVRFGLADDKQMPLDYDGDGRTDVAVFRPSSGVWYINQSSTGQLRISPWGLPTDRLVPGDYDGDGTADLAVFRDGIWYVQRSTSGALGVETFGSTGDQPAAASFIQ